QERVMKELRAARMGWYSMLQPEPRTVASILHNWEHVAGAVYGYSPEGFAMLTATNSRIIFNSKKLVFTHIDEITFEAIKAVTFESVGLYCRVTLHTEIGEYTICTINSASARRFV